MATEVLRDVTFEDGPSVGALLSERDALAAENARLRSAAEALISAMSSGGYIDGRIYNVVGALEAALAARALVESPR